jgi:hypothetical protein
MVYVFVGSGGKNHRMIMLRSLTQNAKAVLGIGVLAALGLIVWALWL